ncbi:uncharacterized protein LOC142351660 [Convolutriloba macropyga]|uniref:uncharacterized protein LOC142351660 n=1 Tax=Convolutriloba macropyga TaxID=536237 RepID=UPI003F51F9F6
MEVLIFVQERSRECRGYSKYGIGYNPLAVEAVNCEDHPSEPETSSRRWFWLKETLGGETTDCQIEHDRLGYTPSANRHKIKIRGYEIWVYCEWGQFGAPTLTYFDQQGSNPSFSLWGGSIYYSDPSHYDISRRVFQQARIEVNRCFVVVDIQDISHATITEGPTYYDEFYYMYYGAGGDCRSSRDNPHGVLGEVRIDLQGSPFMFPAGLYFDFTGWKGRTNTKALSPQLLTMTGYGGCGLGASFMKDPNTRVVRRMSRYMPLNLYCFDCG